MILRPPVTCVLGNDNDFTFALTHYPMALPVCIILGEPPISSFPAQLVPHTGVHINLAPPHSLYLLSGAVAAGSASHLHFGSLNNSRPSAWFLCFPVIATPPLNHFTHSVILYNYLLGHFLKALEP